MLTRHKPVPRHSPLLAYVVGVALGDGNLSNPNGRATRLRVTCDAKYPILATKIRESLQALFPDNKVSVVRRAATYFDLSCYSNQWESVLGWRVGGGTKVEQRIGVPDWIKGKEEYIINCLRGLLETDGTIYTDRGYRMVMFATVVLRLAEDVHGMMESLGFAPHTYCIYRTGGRGQIFHVRLSRKVPDFLDCVRPAKV